MIELLPFTGTSDDSGNSAEDFFFYDGPDAQTISINRYGAAAYETTPTIDGKTLVLSGVNDRMIITLSKAIDMLNLDWTLEWSTINQTDAVSAYASELMLHGGAPDDTTHLIARYGDAGFGNRLQFGAAMTTLQNSYAVPYNKTTMVGSLKRIALVQKDKNITVFINGVKQLLALGAGYTYNVASFVNDLPATNTRRIVIGDWLNGGSGAVPAKRGPMRLSMRALYTADYTPAPIG